MENCKYCYRYTDERTPLLKHKLVEIIIIPNSTLEFTNGHGDWKSVKINYCPICGRKLNCFREEENTDGCRNDV